MERYTTNREQAVAIRWIMTNLGNMHLAVLQRMGPAYLHATLVANPVFPNRGADLKHSAVQHLSGEASLKALNSVQTSRLLDKIINEKTAYILTGSFVGF